MSEVQIEVTPTPPSMMTQASPPPTPATPVDGSPKLPYTETPKEAATVQSSDQEPKPALTDKVDPAKQGPEFAPFNPENLKLDLPEGVTPDPKVIGEIKTIADKYGLSQGAVQDLMGIAKAEITKVAMAGQTAWNDLNTKWVGEVKADKEVGDGQGLKPEVAEQIGKLMADTRYVDPGFKEALNLTGAGNNPAVIRTFARIAKAISEGSHVAGAPGQGQSRKGFAESMYPQLP